MRRQRGPSAQVVTGKAATERELANQTVRNRQTKTGFEHQPSVPIEVHFRVSIARFDHDIAD